jgi:hypothetical protein
MIFLAVNIEACEPLERAKALLDTHLPMHYDALCTMILNL